MPKYLEPAKALPNLIDLSNDQSPTAESLYISYMALADLNTKDLAKVTTIIKNSFPGDQNKELREIIDAPLLQHLVMAEAIERQVGLDDIRYNADYRTLEGIRNPNDPKKVIDAMLRDKRVAQQAEFEGQGKKTAGVSAGYVAKDNAGNTFILKHFIKLMLHAKNTR
ncbi:hypothetical protein RAMDARK_1822 [Rickettsia amblyommatis str. Darkwater]|nr:hypothetical protein RAMDARK_1822 [Rickettsia amblyommatis str. Darkwater]